MKLYKSLIIKSSIVLLAAVILFGTAAAFRLTNPFNAGIAPLYKVIWETNAQELQEQTQFRPEGKHVEVSFTFERQSTVASNQIAVWVTDLSGKLIKTLYVSNFTAQGGYRDRPNSLQDWTRISDPDSVLFKELNGFAGATPKSGEYCVYWDFTDRQGQKVSLDEYYNFYVAGTLYDGDDVLYKSGNIKAVETQLAYYNLTPKYTNPDSGFKSMLSNVNVEYYPG